MSLLEKSNVRLSNDSNNKQNKQDFNGMNTTQLK